MVTMLWLVGEVGILFLAGMLFGYFKKADLELIGEIGCTLTVISATALHQTLSPLPSLISSAGIEIAAVAAGYISIKVGIIAGEELYNAWHLRTMFPPKRERMGLLPLFVGLGAVGIGCGLSPYAYHHADDKTAVVVAIALFVGGLGTLFARTSRPPNRW